MPALWRLTRTDHARRVYETLKRVGITGTRMYQYVADPTDGRGAGGDADGVRLETRTREDVGNEYEAFAELLPEERVICALDDETIVGYLFVSLDARHRIHPLEETLRFDGGYVRRVFVRPDYRNRGIATALVSRARKWAADRDATAVHALVARDNKPSRWLFESNGFEPRHEHVYYRVGPLSHRSIEQLGGEGSS
ncbi:GNAT family N-acetyltransferase [Halogeometricum borinquense]|uniref:GNAT family N-acetyltransferase n=1 Tax=Halogeometricum borinquense TaxID=60847 RepID=A0A6C0USD1_9EURY|nr:GNAT family N-acetyltransferase [Halogeometricum borinquense]QIB75858.1 GNAT family N-acetyltransferase [Halogeometricum borinquense]QIQ75558.1 GNAT family N-acetyltransferase [Halogeometricum borinquense]